MTRQFMVRIVREPDGEYADVVVDAESKFEAKMIALNIVIKRPDRWFDNPKPLSYFPDSSSDVEDVTGGDYASANEVRP